MRTADYLEDLEKKYQQKYGVAVFDIEIKNTKSGVEIEGEVLTKNQKDDVLGIFKKKKIKIAKENVGILSDTDERNEIGWAIVKKDIVDLKSRFVSNKILNNKILARIRCSQTFKGEVLRVLFKKEDQLLVQQNDLTLGWVSAGDVVVKKKSLYKEWKSGNFALKNKALNLKNIKFKKISIFNCHSELVSESIIDFKKDSSIQDNQKISDIKIRQSVNQKKIPKQVRDDKIQNKIIKEVKKYLGAKYVLGGKSERGIDCSGLVQVVYKNSLGVILPKHSWDQKECGRKIKLENVKTGDLVFLIKKKNGHKHVGIAEVCESAKRLHGSEAETVEPAISSVISSISEKSVALDISTNLDFSQVLEMTISGQPGVNLIHASLDKKKVVRQNLEEVLESYDFVEARRVVE